MDLKNLHNRRFGVLGLGKSGQAAVRALAQAGAQAVVFDDTDEAVQQACSQGAAAGTFADLETLHALIVSPGVPLRLPAPHPVITEAQQSGTPIIADLDLFAARLSGQTVIGVTGTNGKSTTSALIHHLLVSIGQNTLLGGNIGTAALDLPIDDAVQSVVLELSSFQLDLVCQLRCNISIWLNIAPDHLDRHGTLGDYIAAKAHIFDRQRADDQVVIAIDDAPSQAMADHLEGQDRRVTRVSSTHVPAGGVGVGDAWLIDDLAGSQVKIIELATLPRLAGRHNQQNIVAAYAALRRMGIAGADIARHFTSFAGLAHRSELVGQAGAITFINDSKATNPAAAVPSLQTYSNIFWLAGGKAKPGGFASLQAHLDHIAHSFFFGEARNELAADLGTVRPFEVHDDMTAAFLAALKAARLATADATVLLAPACASFDQFTSFEARGEAFKTLVRDFGLESAA